MEILLFRHYPLVEDTSMRSFALLIATGLRARGHQVREITAPLLLGRFAKRQRLFAKWLGYLDRYVLFHLQLWWLTRRLHPRTLCVFCDQALGPWIPALKRHPHVVHVHDLLALQAAYGHQPFHHLGWSGRLYQRWICHCFRQAKCFLSVSNATHQALAAELRQQPLLNAVVLNPLPPRFRPLPTAEAAAVVDAAISTLGSKSFIFHIGSVWYKNRHGVLTIWEQLCSFSSTPPALVLVGALEPALQQWLEERPHLKLHLEVLDRPSDDLVLALYNRAAALLFPSHAEGFGWPVLEALACGCPVVTTGRPPMTEVGGEFASYIPPVPTEPSAIRSWARCAAEQVGAVLARSNEEQQAVRSRSIAWAQAFSQAQWLDQLEAHYSWVVNHQEKQACAG